MATTHKVRITLNDKTAAEWAAWPSAPLMGEPCWATDTKVLKIGDGVTMWSSLPEVGGATDHAALSNLDFPSAGHTGELDGDSLPAMSASKRGGVPATGTPANKFLRDDGTFQTVAGGSVPTGTGFRHVTAGAEDAAAKLVENVDVDASAAIAESKLALNYPTHSSANDPTAGEKTALTALAGYFPFALKTTTEMNAISSPTEGMAVWNTTEHQLYVYDGIGWHGVPMQA